MSKNTKDDNKETQILMSEADAMMSPREDLNPSEIRRFFAFPPSNSFTKNPQEEGDDDDEEKNPIQKNFLSFSSDEASLSPCVIAEQGIKLEEDKEKKKANGCLKFIKRIFNIYCEVTPGACLVRERLALLLTVLICSKLALETQKTENLISQLFLASYCCLGYMMFESILLYRFSKTQTMESLFDLTNKALLTFGVLLWDLKRNKLMNEKSIAILPVLFMLELVIYNCLVPHSKEKDKKNIWRVFCLFQAVMIAAKFNNLVEFAPKINNLVDFEWKETLVFTWFYLGATSLYVSFAVLLLAIVILTSILSLDIRTLRLLINKIDGYIWHICFSLLNVVGLIILFGLFKKIDSQGSEDVNGDDILQLGLTYAKKLSSFLAAFSALWYPILRKSDFNIFQDLGTAFQNQVGRLACRKKYTLVKTEDQNKSAFFLMISPACLSLLESTSQSESQEMMQKKLHKMDKGRFRQNQEERRLCSLCESHVSDAILGECGHGGVCCKCAIKLIEQKNECMECKKPATAIYKIVNNSKDSEGVVQAHEIVRIIQR